MATYTSNYGWTKPSGSDNVDISVLNNNLDDQDSTIHDAFLNMAPPFSESSTYAVDDIVLYGTGLYKCHTAVVTPGSWTGSSNWQVYKLSEGGSGGGGGYVLPTATASRLGGVKIGSGLHVEEDGTISAEGGSTLEAGDYIDITEGVISVKKEKGEYLLERYVLQSTGGGAPKLVVKKYIDPELISTNEYANNTAHVNIDDTLEIWYSYNPYNWHYKLLVDGVDHSAGYEYEFSYEDTTEYPVDFRISAGDSTDLVTKGDLTAENILMSDGTTSVEDKVDELTDYVVDTTTISGVKITKMGHLVMLSIDKTITMNGSQWVNVGTVPYKPTTEIFGVAKQNAVDKIISIDLPTNGNLAVMGSGSSAILVRGSLTYLTSD